MTTQTNEFFNKGMNQMFDAMNDGFKTMFDAGRKTQDMMFKSMSDMFAEGSRFTEMTRQNEWMSRELFPAMQNNIDLAAETFSTCFKASEKFVGNAFDIARATKEQDVQEQPRKFFDAGFEMFRASTDAVTKANNRVFENATHFWSSACCERTNGAAKAASKTSK